MAYKIYTSGNYFYIVDTTNNRELSALAKNVEITRGTTAQDTFFVVGVRNWNGDDPLPIANIQDETGTPYASTAAFITFYEENTGKSSPEAAGGALTAYKTVDESKTNDDVLDDDADLNISLEASSTYAFRTWFLFTAGGTGDIKLKIKTVTGASGKYSRQNSADTDSAFDYDFTTNGAGSGTGTFKSVEFKGYIKTTSGGTFQIQWAQQTSNATATTLREGSWIELIKLN